MFRSSILWFQRRMVDLCFSIGILAFLVNSSISFHETPSEDSKPSFWKLFEKLMARIISTISGCIFNINFGTLYFCRRFLTKHQHFFKWLRKGTSNYKSELLFKNLVVFLKTSTQYIYRFVFACTVSPYRNLCQLISNKYTA